MPSFVCRHPLFVILLGALALRVAAAGWLQHDLDAKRRPFLIMGDAEGYWDLGECIAHGKPYEVYNPPRRVLRMPGFPIFEAGSICLAEILGISDSAYLTARLLSAGIGTLACGLVALLGRELFDARIGNIAAAITAIAPPLIGFSVILLSETLFAAALLINLWCMARLTRVATQPVGKGRLSLWAALTGATVAAAVYVRPSWLLVGPGFAVLFALRLCRSRAWTDSLLAAVVIIGCTYGSLLPWAYRNFRITDHWIFTTLWVGPSLYDGFHPKATGESNMEFFERDRLMDRMSEYEVDQYYRQKAREYARDHPRRALELTGTKLERYWTPWPNAEQFGGIAQRLAVAVYFIPVVLAAVWGWVAGPRTFWGWVLILGPILYFSAVHAVFIGSLRYRLPAEYPLCIASAVGVAQIWRRFSTRAS